MPSLHFRCNNLPIATNSSWEPWIKYNTVDASLYSDSHFSTKFVWKDICNTILKIHTLTGYNAISKIGTKAAALKPNYHLLSSLGEIQDQVFRNLSKLNGHILRSHYLDLICSNMISTPDISLIPVKFD